MNAGQAINNLATALAGNSGGNDSATQIANIQLQIAQLNAESRRESELTRMQAAQEHRDFMVMMMTMMNPNLHPTLHMPPPQMPPPQMHYPQMAQPQTAQPHMVHNVQSQMSPDDMTLANRLI